MSLLFTDSFDDGLTAKWTSWNASINTSTKRTGTGSGALTSNSNRIYKDFPVADQHSTFIVSTAFYKSGAMHSLGSHFAFYEGGGIHLQGRFGDDGSFALRRGGDGSLAQSGGSTTIATTGTIISLNNWVHLEMKAVIHDTTGSFIMKVDGVEQLNFSGDTRNGGTGVIDRINFGYTGDSTNFLLDDLFILNGAGSAPHNDFMGDHKVLSFFPDGNGGLSGFTGSDANSTDNYQLVDEIAISTTDYVESDVAGTIDTYTFGNLATGTPKGVIQRSYAQKTDVGARSMRHVARIGGTNYTGADKVVGSSYGVYEKVWNVDPSTSAAWTLSGVNAAEFGIEVRT